MNDVQSAIASEVASTFAAFTPASRFNDAENTLESAIEAGYVEQAQEPVQQESAITQTVEEITAQITQVSDTIALDAMQFVVKHAEQFADLGANFQAIAQRVDTMKANLRLDLDALRELRSKRKRQDDAARGEIGAAFTEQVLVETLQSLLNGLKLTDDGFDVSSPVEVTMKSGEVRSVTPSSMLADGKRVVLQVNSDGTFTVLSGAAKIGNNASKPKDTITNDTPKAPRALPIEVYMHNDKAVSNGLDAIVPVGTKGTAKEIELMLVQAGKVALRTETATSKYSVPERLRTLGVIFRQVA